MRPGQVAWNKGIPMIFSPETCAKISAAKMGHIVTLETCARISTAQMGRIQSPETRAKMSVAHMGRKPLPETRAKISVAKRGKTGPLHNTWKGGSQVSNRKQKAKRRLLGFNPLNSPFPGCEGHHINKDDVIYEPKKLHRSVPHNVWTGRGMVEANALAGQYLMEYWT
jgi:hypothetical protein